MFLWKGCRVYSRCAGLVFQVMQDVFPLLYGRKGRGSMHGLDVAEITVGDHGRLLPRVCRDEMADAQVYKGPSNSKL